MEYKLTFEDGSKAILAHHGVKGMKWGKWSPETAAKYKAYGTTQGGGGIGGSRIDDEYEKEKEYNSRENNYFGGGGSDEEDDEEKKKADRKKQQDEDYVNESKLNAMEFRGDLQGFLKAQARTNAFYGKRSDRAQIAEAHRRRKSSEEAEKMSEEFKQKYGTRVDSEYESEKNYNSRKNSLKRSFTIHPGEIFKPRRDESSDDKEDESKRSSGNVKINPAPLIFNPRNKKKS